SLVRGSYAPACCCAADQAEQSLAAVGGGVVGARVGQGGDPVVVWAGASSRPLHPSHGWSVRYGHGRRYGVIRIGKRLRPRADLRGDGCDGVIRTQGKAVSEGAWGRWRRRAG